MIAYSLGQSPTTWRSSTARRSCPRSKRQRVLLVSTMTYIVKMPMRYETLVGDMGSTLSGGQKQRILLARALYTQPKILVLDEATSHLDSKNEKVVNDAVMDLEITRIIIAHREQTIAMGDRVFDLSRQTWIR
ncbi:ATP-binding cassette domain-containing protein [Xanthomonas oryzae]|uniref:ATP-binding cassette domain-containing protein n=2 Tax=Xanthomonas TaxID=338 RepID=UPI0023D960B8|nr:ATP-binding cassette domain-containing protein [Xanthomonas oryzae]MDI9070948.1 ATP-binding cassette domain-containing protein [Xanthomonas oryzae pv. oryzae]MDI9079444.1 ATP-binding cassette domain-containing protein [Xanthomonas oryzae pv. oryzae]MDI9102196.1 ATP-binding cassette domain-containing protein [Xanthomonas oryzae pv. oryzae]MDI9910922.1 ATP-binding cassette domain-containing protein [Xanthomonas oryzae pv. oryzae]WEK98581.1 ATP-binding cassette domain-containing protein [Xanth